MRSESEHWTWMVVEKTRRRRKEEEGGRKEATNIKSDNPHLAGGESHT